MTFDPSGQYLGVAAGKAAKVFLAKEWSQVAEYTDAGCVFSVDRWMNVPVCDTVPPTRTTGRPS